MAKKKQPQLFKKKAIKSVPKSTRPPAKAGKVAVRGHYRNKARS